MSEEDVPQPPDPARRRFFRAAGAAAALPAALSWTPHAEGATRAYLFFNTAEAAFIEAAVARLIPKDETGPGALEAGVPEYIDRQLAGAWGAGERLYRSGPWRPGTPSQGYQLPFTPGELFHAALRAIHAEFKDGAFKDLPAEQQDAYLKSLEAGGKDLDGVPSAVFFQMLLQMTV